MGGDSWVQMVIKERETLRASDRTWQDYERMREKEEATTGSWLG